MPRRIKLIANFILFRENSIISSHKGFDSLIYGPSINNEKSNAGAEFVNAPIEIKSTPLSAIDLIFLSETPPEASTTV
jgi:hypothetical protein